MMDFEWRYYEGYSGYGVEVDFYSMVFSLDSNLCPQELYDGFELDEKALTFKLEADDIIDQSPATWRSRPLKIHPEPVRKNSASSLPGAGGSETPETKGPLRSPPTRSPQRSPIQSPVGGAAGTISTREPSADELGGAGASGLSSPKIVISNSQLEHLKQKMQALKQKRNQEKKEPVSTPPLRLAGVGSQQSSPIAPAPAISDCPEAHGLRCFLTPDDGWWCSVCSRKHAKGSSFYGCRICDYDECEKCALTPLSKRGVQSQATSELPPCPEANSDSNVPPSAARGTTTSGGVAGGGSSETESASGENLVEDSSSESSSPQVPAVTATRSEKRRRTGTNTVARAAPGGGGGSGGLSNKQVSQKKAKTSITPRTSSHRTATTKAARVTPVVRPASQHISRRRQHDDDREDDDEDPGLRPRDRRGKLESQSRRGDSGKPRNDSTKSSRGVARGGAVAAAASAATVGAASRGRRRSEESPARGGRVSLTRSIGAGNRAVTTSVPHRVARDAVREAASGNSTRPLPRSVITKSNAANVRGGSEARRGGHGGEDLLRRVLRGSAMQQAPKGRGLAAHALAGLKANASASRDEGEESRALLMPPSSRRDDFGEYFEGRGGGGGSSTAGAATLRPPSGNHEGGFGLSSFTSGRSRKTLADMALSQLERKSRRV